jgi:adenylate kinase family enzyme
VYREQTAPLIDYYEEGGPVPIRISADRAVEPIQKDVREALGVGSEAGRPR